MGARVCARCHHETDRDQFSRLVSVAARKRLDGPRAARVGGDRTPLGDRRGPLRKPDLPRLPRHRRRHRAVAARSDLRHRGRRPVRALPRARQRPRGGRGHGRLRGRRDERARTARAAAVHGLPQAEGLAHGGPRCPTVRDRGCNGPHRPPGSRRPLAGVRGEWGGRRTSPHRDGGGVHHLPRPGEFRDARRPPIGTAAGRSPAGRCGHGAALQDALQPGGQPGRAAAVRRLRGVGQPGGGGHHDPRGGGRDRGRQSAARNLPFAGRPHRLRQQPRRRHRVDHRPGGDGGGGDHRGR